jgi:hypothetical protein
MELAASPPPELLAVAGPSSRGPPEPLKPPGLAKEPDSAAAPFDAWLQLFGNPLPLPLPGGETLPAGAGSSSANGLTASQSAPAGVLRPAASRSAPLPGHPPGPSAVPVGGETLGPDGAAASAASLADALRAMLGAAPPGTASAPAAAPAPAPDAARSLAPGVGPPLEPSLDGAAAEAAPAPVASPADAARAVEAAGGPPLDSLAARLRAVDDSRARSSGAARTADALADVPELADVADALRTESLRLRDAAPAPAAVMPAAVLAGGRGDPAGVPLPAALAEGSAGSSQSAFAALGANGPSTPQPAALPLPPQLGTPVDASAARWQEALSSRIHWLVDHEIGEAQIKLNPPELGALDVKISMHDDKTHVQMTAHTAAARDELAQSLPRLRELLSAGGLDLGSATVSDGRDHAPGRHGAAPTVVRGAAFANVAETPGDAPLARMPASASRIDLFA